MEICPIYYLVQSWFAFLFCRYDYSGYGQSTGKVWSSYHHQPQVIGLLLFHLGLNICFFLWLKPSEHNTYADIEAVYKCLEETYGSKQEDVILYGQSVGSGPTLHLASQFPLLRAIVLHSPILSGLRVMYAVKKTYWFDIYKVTRKNYFHFFFNLSHSPHVCVFYLQNIDKIPYVDCPVLIIHVS